MKPYFRAGGLLVWLVIYFVTLSVRGEAPYTEVYLQDHRCLVVEPAGLPSDAPVVLMLHGFGTNGLELLHLCDELDIPPCLFVLPDAPLRVPHMASGAHAWYDRFTHNYQDMKKSRDYLFAVMDHFSKDLPNPIDPGTPAKPRPVIIMGFSQGAVMSLEAGLNYKGNIKAIVSMSGYIEYPSKTMAHPSAPAQTPILLVRGEWDPVIQEDDTQETMSVLKRAGYHPVLKEFRMGHQVTYATVMAVSMFLQSILDKNP